MGFLNLYAITHEILSLVKVEPILRIELQETSCWTFDWGNSDVVAVGCTNGKSMIAGSFKVSSQPNQALWRFTIFRHPSRKGKSQTKVGSLRSPLATLDSQGTTGFLPQFYTSIHQSAVRAITWIRAPTTSTVGSPLWNEDPATIATGGYDGAQGYIDLRDGAMNEFNRTRGLPHQFLHKLPL